MIYLDNAATTKMSSKVLEAMKPYLTEEYGNASAVYSLGSHAKKAVSVARRQVAAVIGAAQEEIFFTSGGSESDNWALAGVVETNRTENKRHIITTNIEHHAVLNTCKSMEKQGYRVTYLEADENGVITPEQVECAICTDTVLISIMFANNVVGSMQPIREIGEIARRHGILFHTDAVQAYGHVPIDVEEMKIDLLSASAHKLGGPKGVGMLYVRKGILMNSMIKGGSQERKLRAGTENVAGIVGFGKAAELAAENMVDAGAYVSALSVHMRGRLSKEIPGCILNAEDTMRLPGHVSVCIPPVEGESVLVLLDMKGICASSGSACTMGSNEPSHVLLAMGRTPEEAKGSLRFTLSAENTKEEIDETVDELKKIVGDIRNMMGYHVEVKPLEKKKRVVVGMSGGVDSSVAALLLKRQGYDVVGVTMQIWQDENSCRVQENGGCCGSSAVEDARKVAETIDIPYYVMNFKEEFQREVIKPFTEEYLHGRTPNPCILCNRKVKWEALLQRSLEIGADYIATGHYARIEKLDNGRWCIRNSVTSGKDQTYALYNLTQEQLGRTLMPVGDYTKEEIREIAAKAGLPVANKPDSQEICFVPGDDYAAFIDRQAGDRVPGPGDYVTKDGVVLGQHKGITHYTIGQRRGLDLPMGHRVFVTEIRPETNEVVIGENEELFVDRVICERLNFMAIEKLDAPMRVLAKIRYNHAGEYCLLRMIGEDRAECIFEKKVRAATPGQAVVFYENDHVLGGGTIL